jgi:hypothetical protein
LRCLPMRALERTAPRPRGGAAPGGPRGKHPGPVQRQGPPPLPPRPHAHCGGNGPWGAGDLTGVWKVGAPRGWSYPSPKTKDFWHRGGD